ncbi:hypothetical protein THAOC_30624, partial [Thalassiosira oceanica]
MSGRWGVAFRIKAGDNRFTRGLDVPKLAAQVSSIPGPGPRPPLPVGQRDRRPVHRAAPGPGEAESRELSGTGPVRRAGLGPSRGRPEGEAKTDYSTLFGRIGLSHSSTQVLGYMPPRGTRQAQSTGRRRRTTATPGRTRPRPSTGGRHTRRKSTAAPTGRRFKMAHAQ